MSYWEEIFKDNEYRKESLREELMDQW
jgi:hypothetical protein